LLQPYREEIRVDNEVIGEVFLDYTNNLVVIGFREAFQVGLFDDVAEVFRGLAKRNSSQTRM
jgi:hypothetical protein